MHEGARRRVRLGGGLQRRRGRDRRARGSARASRGGHGAGIGRLRGQQAGDLVLERDRGVRGAAHRGVVDRLGLGLGTRRAAASPAVTESESPPKRSSGPARTAPPRASTRDAGGHPGPARSPPTSARAGRLHREHGGPRGGVGGVGGRGRGRRRRRLRRSCGRPLGREGRVEAGGDRGGHRGRRLGGVRGQQGRDGAIGAARRPDRAWDRCRGRAWDRHRARAPSRRGRPPPPAACRSLPTSRLVARRLAVRGWDAVVRRPGSGPGCAPASGRGAERSRARPR